MKISNRYRQTVLLFRLSLADGSETPMGSFLGGRLSVLKCSLEAYPRPAGFPSRPYEWFGFVKLP